MKDRGRRLKKKENKGKMKKGKMKRAKGIKINTNMSGKKNKSFVKY